MKERHKDTKNQRFLACPNQHSYLNKRGLIFIAVFLLLGSLVVVSAADCSLLKCPFPFWNETAGECQCAMSSLVLDTIVKISSPTNAHGEVYNGQNYNQFITYSSIFGATYSGGGDPHNCTGSNIVLKLSSPTNAHAEIPNGSVYTTDVCYGDMQCGLYGPGDSAPIGAQCIVRLSSPTNAHLETCENSNYDYAIYCVSVTEVNCSEYTTKVDCWAASPNCTWTPPETESNPEGGCCPPEFPRWDSFEQICTETANICNSIWALDNQVFGQSFRLSGEQYEYCARVAQGWSSGMWYDIEKF